MRTEMGRKSYLGRKLAENRSFFGYNLCQTACAGVLRKVVNFRPSLSSHLHVHFICTLRLAFVRLCIDFADAEHDHPPRTMPTVDRTAEFRHVLSEAHDVIPDVTRRKLSGPSKRIADGQREKDEKLNREYLAEAYAVVRSTLCTMPTY